MVPVSQIDWFGTSDYAERIVPPLVVEQCTVIITARVKRLCLNLAAILLIYEIHKGIEILA